MIYVIGLGILAGALALLLLNHDTGQIGGMATDDFAYLATAAALAIVLGSAMVFSYRGRLSHALRHAFIWFALALLLVAGYAYREQFKQIGRTLLAELVPGYAVEATSASGGTEVRLRRRADGHFAAAVSVNGTSVAMLVDTGASIITLSHEDARAAGFNTASLAYTVPVSTANGRTMAAPIRLGAVGVGSISIPGLRALVSQPGALRESLLGINFLNSIGSYEVRGDVLILRARP